MERIVDDYSVRVGITGTEDSFIVSPKYDRVDVFGWLGHSILRVVQDEGMAHYHVPEETGRRVAEQTGIPLAECEFMLQSDYENYLTAQANNLEGLFDFGED